MKGRQLTSKDIPDLHVGDYIIIEPTISKYEKEIGKVETVMDEGKYNNGQHWVITNNNWTFPDDLEICNIFEDVDE